MHNTPTLHSTMFLLIRFWKWSGVRLYRSFTFHDVSINTANLTISSVASSLFTFHDVSINTINELFIAE